MCQRCPHPFESRTVAFLFRQGVNPISGDSGQRTSAGFKKKEASGSIRSTLYEGVSEYYSTEQNHSIGTAREFGMNELAFEF